MRIASLVLEAGCRRSSRLQRATIRLGSWRRQLSRLLRKIRSGQGQTGLNCAEPSLPGLAFSPGWVPFAAETLVGTLHLTGDYSRVDTPPSLLGGWAARKRYLEEHNLHSDKPIFRLSIKSMLALAHSGSLDLPFLLPFDFFFPVVRLVDEVVGGDSSYSRCRFPSAEIPIPANNLPIRHCISK